MRKFYSKMTLRWLLACFGVAFLSAGPAWAASDNKELKSTKIDFSIKKGKIVKIMNEVPGNTNYVFLYRDTGYTAAGVSNVFSKRVVADRQLQREFAGRLHHFAKRIQRVRVLALNHDAFHAFASVC